MAPAFRFGAAGARTSAAAFERELAERAIAQQTERQVAARVEQQVLARQVEREAAERIAAQQAERAGTARLAEQGAAKAGRTGIAGRVANFVEKRPVIAGTGLLLAGTVVADQLFPKRIVYDVKFPELPTGPVNPTLPGGVDPSLLGPGGLPGPSYDTSGLLGNITAGLGSALDRMGAGVQAFAAGIGVPLGEGAGKAIAIGGTLVLAAIAVKTVLPAIAGSASSAGAGAAKAAASSAAKASGKAAAKAGAKGAARGAARGIGRVA